nr:immunoglobulin light chain junction region [Macaca mulatta]
CIQGIQFPFTF